MVNAYALAGVDSGKIKMFERIMGEVGEKTRDFSQARNVVVESLAHSASFRYLGSESHLWAKTLEGLGNKNWLAEWMYKFGDMLPHYFEVGIDTILMAANDVITSGARPVLIMDEISAGDSEWFADEIRTCDLGRGYYWVAKKINATFGGGESASLRYLVKPLDPVFSAPVMSASVTGIINPAHQKITEDVQAGDVILGARSSGMHANGYSLALARGLALKDQFMTKLPSGRKLGIELLEPTRSYVGLVEALLDSEVKISAFMPATGDGVSKICKLGHFTFEIHSWVKVHEIFEFMLELGIQIRDCLTTFNWGVGYYVFVRPEHVSRAVKSAYRAGFDLVEIGQVKNDGDHCVVFGPEGGLILSPPH